MGAGVEYFRLPRRGGNVMTASLHCENAEQALPARLCGVDGKSAEPKSKFPYSDCELEATDARALVMDDTEQALPAPLCGVIGRSAEP